MNRRHSHLPLGMLVMLSWRNIWRHRRRTLITLSSIAIGFALSVLMIGLNDGAHNSMIRNAIKLGEGHLTVQPRGYIEAPANHKYLTDGMTLQEKIDGLHVAGRVEPRISLQILASTASNSVGAGLEGLSPLGDQRADLLRPQLVDGAWIEPGDQRGILIGNGMAGKLKAKIGSKVVLMAGKQGGDSQAQLGRVRGIFDSRVDELDDYLILSDIQLARRFLEGEGADPALQPITRFALFLDNPDSLPEWKAELKTAVENDQVVVLDWREMMPQLVQFIMVDDAGNYIFLVLILIMVVFGILNTVLMSVLERTREFGLLRALGISRYHLLWLVFCESLLLSLLAVGIGWIVAGAVHLWFASHGIDMAALMGGSTEMMGTFMDPVIYTELSGERVLQLTLLIFAATLGSGIYPAIKASRVTPVEALRT
ncbi:ABC transporter permease [Sedimenticola sp.]|uniref:ABC transporter permease n=1 Tax=Sedimenticola sp. TaxID=1940285 RepID=UPI00258377A9|nr:FtsX-like permease family protein [Sedimenticola sp.]MCW8903102.1 ABC transporter permease [Sedimenticola sp.]